MPGELLQRWTIGSGGFIAEVSLFDLSAEDNYVRGRDRRTFVELSNLHCHPLRRGRGWSRSLMTAALSYAKRQGWCVFLRCVPYNNPTLDADQLVLYYGGFGFKSRKADRREMIWKPHTKVR